MHAWIHTYTYTYITRQLDYRFVQLKSGYIYYKHEAIDRHCLAVLEPGGNCDEMSIV